MNREDRYWIMDCLAMIGEKVADRIRLIVHGTNNWPEHITKLGVDRECVKTNVNELGLLACLNYLKSCAPGKSLTTTMERGNGDSETYRMGYSCMWECPQGIKIFQSSC